MKIQLSNRISRDLLQALQKNITKIPGTTMESDGQGHGLIQNLTIEYFDKAKSSYQPIENAQDMRDTPDVTTSGEDTDSNRSSPY